MFTVLSSNDPHHPNFVLEVAYFPFYIDKCNDFIPKYGALVGLLDPPAPSVAGATLVQARLVLKYGWVRPLALRVFHNWSIFGLIWSLSPPPAEAISLHCGRKQ